MSYAPGSRLGPYEIIAPIGAGGMGEVYRARHVSLGREAAIKVLPDDLATDPEHLRRFEREARAASALNHPSIVTIYDISEDAGKRYIAMELVHGTTLHDRLLEGPMDPAEAVRLATQIAGGLERAHAEGIVHRDLKPENVMITADGTVKILDFGLAKHVPTGGEALPGLSEMTNQGTLLGTTYYMSPEQAAGEPVDHLSDQFSFGIVLFEMLCGERPFDGPSMASVLSAIMRDDPPPCRSVNPKVSREMEAIVQRCLTKDPAGRYPSTTELREALDRSSRFEPARGFAIDRRSLLVGGAGLAVAVLAIAWFTLRDDLVRWMERDTFARVASLIESGDTYEAFRLARALQAKLPDDAEAQALLHRVTLPITIATDPPGAQVEVKAYAKEDAPWMVLGTTPLQGVRIPYALTHWRIRKEGYETFEGAPFGIRPLMAFANGFKLEPEGTRPEGMVRVPGGPYTRLGFPTVELPDYWIDRYEVTNRDFKAFVDAGGYANADLWREPFVLEGRTLPRDEALQRFVDRTGRPGPAGWELGTYADGEGELPVGGVSWYEAAAYCRSLGKELPTVYHWSAATVQDQLSDIVAVSNFERTGPAAVGSYRGLGDFGTYDMAGNVKEWCRNEGERGRYILGGAWDEPTYMYRVDADMRPPEARAATHGFRCIRCEEPPEEALVARVVPSYYVPGETTPVNDQLFDAYRSLYAYDPSDLAATVESVDESSPHWIMETVAFDAAYGDERVLAHLFLPRNAKPPYQAVVWFPGNDALMIPPGEGLASRYLFDFIPRSGRVLVYPVYKGMYERYVPFSFAPNEWRDMIVLWSKDLSRTVDYLEQRSDIDSRRLGYYGFSAGAVYGPIFTAIDGRFEASVLLGGGLFGDLPPEANVVNFAPRSHVPTLMINGEDDFLNPYETSQVPFFRLLGAAEGDKRLARFEGGHIVPDRIMMMEEVLGWFDRFMGEVDASGSGQPMQTRR